MKTPGRASHPVLVLVSVAALAGATACGGSSGSSSGTPSAPVSVTRTPSGTSQAPSSPASSSSSPAKTVAPVPVESNPPGDIPDNLAFVRYTNPAGGYSFTHPEGWARTVSGTRVRFTDKLNGVTVESLTATRAPTPSSARTDDVARLKGSVPAFQLRSVSSVHLPAGRGVHLVFRRNSAPDSVTGKVYRDDVEEYDVFGHGRLVRMDLYGPVGADNVDAYRTMSQSLRTR
jgi:hypothetical protein